MKYFNEWKFHGPVGPVRHVIMFHYVQDSVITGVNKGSYNSVKGIEAW